MKILAAGGNFADGVIVATAQQAKADHLASFDETLARLSEYVSIPVAV
jgi:predicted nucleic acid-binding protein